MKLLNHLGQLGLGQAQRHIAHLFINGFAHDVHTTNWQATDISKRPEGKMKELMNVTFTSSLGAFNHPDLNVVLDDLAQAISPNLPWADDHFAERVCGQPINPGEQWAKWPWGHSADKFRDDNGQFNHNYMERLWPKYAGNEPDENGRYDTQGASAHQGIRNEYGDLKDLVLHIVDDPDTRQAWFPIYHPEDVGQVVGGRKPCTLGYQFMIRNDLLHIYYPLRSCDFYRHWADDVYLAIRLGIWVLEQCRELRPLRFRQVKLGSYSMHCTSLHMFMNDWHQLKAKGA